ncbi:hypothetical protein GCM10023310_36680 [Paenibacillus vulneris]|uniref:DUF1450 domain-containing protein n=1 Tax=Paenibacillus vulneris TaxID=1133364 RepID=A0ABW3UN66_9BACL|nr:MULTISPECIES: DUF1450 domain-containing protein [unclassified Paenibacillus]MBE1443480.1 uncharacterized protein YuzB (UPF0349 family) [Paenibacillus sp. OAS669]
MKIKYCCRNFKHGSKSVYKTMKKQFPEMKQKKRDCLGACKLCSRQCIAKVGKADVICAPSAEKLYEVLLDLIG